MKPNTAETEVCVETNMGSPTVQQEHRLPVCSDQAHSVFEANITKLEPAHSEYELVFDPRQRTPTDIGKPISQHFAKKPCRSKQPSPPATLEVTALHSSPCPERECGRNHAVVLHEPSVAKAKLLEAKATEEVMAVILRLGPKKPALMPALTNCLCSDDTATVIAQKHSLCNSLLSYWSRRLGLPERRRGRRALRQPTAEHQRILELVRVHGVVETARRIGVSKQRIHQVVCQWAPELRRHRAARKVAARPPRKRHAPRKITVSFRISTEEWQRLLAARFSPAVNNLSGFGKARAIVLNAIAPSRGHGGQLARASASQAPGTTNHEVVNVHNQEAA